MKFQEFLVFINLFHVYSMQKRKVDNIINTDVVFHNAKNVIDFFLDLYFNSKQITLLYDFVYNNEIINDNMVLDLYQEIKENA